MGLEGIVSKARHEPLQVGLVRELREVKNPAYERR
jgi:hypothetical protein